jgi:glycosyltransferase involved in cell wall biosynthesis
MPQISVVIPIFNTERYLEGCLLSVLDQSFSDFEVICVDDLSPDRSREIVEHLMRADPRIRLICLQENRGLGGARNAGLAAAKSNYVAFVDSDDYVDTDMLQLLHTGTENEAFDVVICGYRTVDQEGRVLAQYSPEKKRITNTREVKDRLLLGNPGAWNKLWRKSLFFDNKILFPPKVAWEDLATTPKLMLKAKSINFIDRVCYNYVNRPGSLSNVASDKHIFDYVRAFDGLKDFLIAEGIYAGERHNLETLVRFHFSWYADRLLTKKNEDAAGVREYAKYCALLAGGYIDFDDRFRDMDTAELVKQISTLGVRPEPQAANAITRLRNFAFKLMQPRKSG